MTLMPRVVKTLSWPERSVLCINAIFIAGAGTLLLLLVFEPANLRYPNQPIPVCKLDKPNRMGTISDTSDICQPIDLVNGITPGDAPTLMVQRCVDDPFADNSEDTIYSFDRELVSSTSSLRIGMPSGISSAPAGCHPVLLHFDVIPPSTPPGIYHLESHNVVRGRLRVATVQWMSTSFQVMEH